MVNVNKNIVPGNMAESSAKTEPQAPARRPRNAKLNSSKSATSTITGVNLANIRKLNCSRESVIQELHRWLSEEEAKDYLEAFENETGAQVVRLASPEEAASDGDFWAVKDGKEQLWYRTDGEWYTKDDLDGAWYVKENSSEDPDDDWSFLNSSKKLPKSIKDRRKQKLNCSREDASVDVESCLETLVNHMLDYAPELIHSKTYLGDLDTPLEEATFYVEADGEYVEPITDAITSIKHDDYDAFIAQPGIADIPIRYYCTATMSDGEWRQTTMGNLRQTFQEVVADIDSSEVNSTKNQGRNCSGESYSAALNCSEGADLADVKITTESGNEVSMQDIKIVQNPDTNELAIFIPEDEEETIPEGFRIIGMVIPDAVYSTPAIEGDELDSSKKKE